MRIGSNPEKANKEIVLENYHRVIDTFRYYRFDYFVSNGYYNMAV